MARNLVKHFWMFTEHTGVWVMNWVRRYHGGRDSNIVLGGLGLDRSWSAHGQCTLCQDPLEGASLCGCRMLQVFQPFNVSDSPRRRALATPQGLRPSELNCVCSAIDLSCSEAFIFWDWDFLAFLCSQPLWDYIASDCICCRSNKHPLKIKYELLIILSFFVPLENPSKMTITNLLYSFQF